MVTPYARTKAASAGWAGTGILIPVTNAIERLHEEFKRRIKTQTVLPSADTAAMLFWALLASGQINMRKVDGWQTLATKPIDQPIDLAAWAATFMLSEIAPNPIPTAFRTAPLVASVWWDQKNRAWKEHSTISSSQSARWCSGSKRRPFVPEWNHIHGFAVFRW
jgi:hypothetical protein